MVVLTGVKYLLPQGTGQICKSASTAPGTFYLPTAAGIYKTINGVNFDLMAGSPENATKATIDPNDPSILYSTAWRAGNGGIWKFQNNTWSRIHTDTYIADIAVRPGDSKTLIAVTNDHPYHDICSANGIYLSINQGIDWELVNDGLAVLRGEVIGFNPYKNEEVLFGSNGRGFYKATIPNITILKSVENTPEENGYVYHSGNELFYHNSNSTDIYSLQLFDITSRLVYQKNDLAKGSKDFKIELTGIPPGIYILIAEDNNKNILKTYKLRVY